MNEVVDPRDGDSQHGSPMRGERSKVADVAVPVQGGKRKHVELKTGNESLNL